MTQRSLETPVLNRPSIIDEAVDQVMARAREKAADLGIPMAIAVVDESGVLKAFCRMDRAPLLGVEIAQDKAYTSVAFGIPTHEWFEFIRDDPPLLHGANAIRRLVVFGGGYPITFSGEVIGGIGVSGGHYEQDMEVAQAGVAALD